jgi:hypothetical protein
LQDQLAPVGKVKAAVRGVDLLLDDQRVPIAVLQNQPNTPASVAGVFILRNSTDNLAESGHVSSAADDELL